MGRKKSVVLLVLLTIVIVALCLFAMMPVFGTFVWKGAVSKWNPVVKTYDFDGTLGGGYYTYYYPEGVISETEYKFNAEDKPDEYNETTYKAFGGLYLSTDVEDGVLDAEGNVTAEFKSEFKAAAKTIAARFAKRGYSSYRVSVVDDYAIKVEIPVTDTVAGSTLSFFAETGSLKLTDGTNTLKEFNEEDPANDYFKSFKLKEMRGTHYIEAALTAKGRKLIKEQTSSLVSSESGSGSLVFMVGDTTAIQLTVSEVINEKELTISGGGITEDSGAVMAILLQSTLENGGYEIDFTVDETRSLGSAASDGLTKSVVLLYVALSILLVACLVVPVVLYRGYGVAMGYSTLTYFVVTALFFAFIVDGVFEFTLGTMLAFTFGLILMLVMNARVYNAIQADFATGKTVESSVKTGYKKTIASTVDVYVVLVLAALLLLIGAAGLHTMAAQLLICLGTAAFCNLLWTRFINFLLVSANKNKMKYFGFKREDDDDE